MPGRGKAEGKRKEVRMVQTACDQEKWGRGFRMERVRSQAPGGWRYQHLGCESVDEDRELKG